MRPDTESCLSSDSLEAIAAGQDVSAEFAAHVEACSACRAAVQRIRDDNAYLASFRISGAWPGAAPAEEAPGISIPGYDHMHELHRGGQGVILKAVQRSTKRDVAIKVLRRGFFATAVDRARFTREIETLGRLNHPNIVDVHDAGVVNGLQYFVMDFVNGPPLDEAVRLWPASAGESQSAGAAALCSVRDVLECFVKVCDAVHSAHLCGVMHRDLKPSNIRVDANGEPQVLDFGLAKSVGETETGMTMEGQFVGSMPWASPEQVEGRPNRIDLRTDIYSLGAILYQLLTGDTPFSASGSLRETIDDIQHRDPPPPSTIAAGRGVRIHGDLNTIVLKAMAKERDRRYQSADELSRDLRHYLAGEAIDAKRDSAWYVLRKTAWRKRRVLAAVAIPMLLFPFVLIALYRSSLATQQAELERELREVASVRNAAMLEISRRLYARPTSDPNSPGGRLSKLNIDAIQNDLDTGSLSVSDHGAALLLAEAMRDRGKIVDAEVLVRRAIYMLQCAHGPKHAEFGRMHTMLADILIRRGTRMAEAEQVAETAVGELSESFGAKSPETARGWIVLARVRLTRGNVDGALQAADAALAAVSQEPSIVRADAQIEMARIRAERGENELARAAILDAVRSMLLLTHDTDTPLLNALETAADMMKHGIVDPNDLFDATARQGALDTLSPDAALLETAAILRGGADGTPRDSSVLPARQLMVALREHMLGPDHPSLGASLAVVGGILFQNAQIGRKWDNPTVEASAALFARAIPLQIAAYGPDSTLVGKSYEKMATCMSVLSRIREAADWYTHDCELWMRQPAGLHDDYQVLVRARWTAWFNTRAGNYEAGLEWTDRTLDVLARTLGTEDGGAAMIHACRALCFAELGRNAEAEASDARAVHLLATQPLPDDQRFECGRLLGLARLRLGRPVDARQVMEPAWAGARDRYDNGDTAFRLEWSETMRTYCNAIGDAARAEQFTACLRNEATGDYSAAR